MLNRIKELCKAMGITIAELERKAELAPRYIYKWDENTPSADKLYRVAKVLGVTVEELLEGAKAEKEAV